MSERPPSTCLFLPELPADLTDQVLERHFRGFVGYDSSRTKHDRNGRLVGFVEFTTVDDAVRCRDSMQGASPFPGVHWQIHFSNNTQSRPTASAKRQRSEESEPPLAQRNSFPMEPPRPMAPRRPCTDATILAMRRHLIIITLRYRPRRPAMVRRMRRPRTAATARRPPPTR